MKVTELLRILPSDPKDDYEKESLRNARGLLRTHGECMVMALASLLVNKDYNSDTELIFAKGGKVAVATALPDSVGGVYMHIEREFAPNKADRNVIVCSGAMRDAIDSLDFGADEWVKRKK